MIESLQIKNFKCFFDAVVPFKKLTILAGANGGGKSTVIQSLLLLKQTIDKIKDRSIRDDDSVNIKLNEIFNLNLGNSKDVTNVITDSEHITLTVPFQNKPVSFQYSASKDEPELFICFDSDISELFTSEDNKLLSILSNSFHYLMAERIGPRDVQSISDQDQIFTGFAGEYTGYAMYKSADEKVAEEKCIYNDITGKSNLFKKQVEAWMDLILPGIEIHSNLYEEMNSARVGLRRKGSETDYLKPPNIGFGITYVLPIIVSGLVAKENGMFIVENPEVHLHPLGQSKIGQFLAQIAGAGIQVIVETHSEHVINGVRLAILKDRIRHNDVIINYLNQERNTPFPNIEPITLNKEADLSKWPNGFMDQEENDLGEIFRLRRMRQKKC